MIEDAIDRVMRWEALLDQYIKDFDFRFTIYLIRWINKENEFIRAASRSYLEAEINKDFPVEH